MVRRILLTSAVLLAALAVPATASAEPGCSRAGYQTRDSRAYYKNCNHHAVLGTTIIATGRDVSKVCIEGKTSGFLGSTNPAASSTGWVTGFRVDDVLDGSYCTFY